MHFDSASYDLHFEVKNWMLNNNQNDNGHLANIWHSIQAV